MIGAGSGESWSDPSDYQEKYYKAMDQLEQARLVIERQKFKIEALQQEIKDLEEDNKRATRGFP